MLLLPSPSLSEDPITIIAVTYVPCISWETGPIRCVCVCVCVSSVVCVWFQPTVNQNPGFQSLGDSSLGKVIAEQMKNPRLIPRTVKEKLDVGVGKMAQGRILAQFGPSIHMTAHSSSGGSDALFCLTSGALTCKVGKILPHTNKQVRFLKSWKLWHMVVVLVLGGKEEF